MSQPPPNLFDPTLTPHRLRRATEDGLFLHRHAAALISERLKEVNRRFQSPVIVGHHPRIWAEALGFAALHAIPPEPTLALGAGAHDLVLHALCLHGLNDPVGQLIQARRALRPDGLFLGALFAAETLGTLRAAFATAEAKVWGGICPRVAPMGDLRALGGLLQRAGFALPVADSLTVGVSYADPVALMRDVRAMGEASTLAGGRRPLSRAVLAELAAAYPTGPDGRIMARIDIAVLTGWAPDAGQPRPLRPGSATHSLAAALGARRFSEDGKEG